MTPSVTRSASRPNDNDQNQNRRHEAFLRRADRARILRSRRQQTRARTRRHGLTSNRRASRQPLPLPLREDEQSQSQIIRDHFSRMRSPRRTLSSFFKGIQKFNSDIDIPEVSAFLQPDLQHEDNYICPHCDAMLWHEERKRRYSCCKNGDYAIHPLHDIPLHLWALFETAEFSRNQRKYKS